MNTWIYTIHPWNSGYGIMRKPLLYLDVCTLCRPFDDQSMMRIRLETDSYHLIMQAIQEGKYQMVYSTVHELEISAISDAWERMELLEILHQNGVKSTGDLQTLRKRANGLAERGMGVADAAHIAFSEISADYFISCDDRLIKQCHRQVVDVTVMTPVEFCLQENLK